MAENKKKNTNVQVDVDSADMMTLTGHLKELKNRILVCLGIFAVAFFFTFQYASTVVDFLTELGAASKYVFVYLSPQELFMQYFKVAGIGALVIALPVIFYEIWAFMSPGLSRQENLMVFFSMLGGLLFFALGVVFAYFIALPFMLNFFMSVNTTSMVSSSISIKEYISFLITIFIVFGTVFELPVVSCLLSILGLVTPTIMIKGRPFAIVIIFVLGALITPPDVVSQCMVALPMILLYQLSIILCKFIYRWKKKKEIEEENDD